VAGEWIQCLDQKILNAERPQDAKQVLEPDSAVGRLDAANHSSRDIGALGELSLGETAQLPPRSDTFSQAPQATANRDRRLAIPHFMVHM
jgi:hypothetical protein